MVCCHPAPCRDRRKRPVRAGAGASGSSPRCESAPVATPNREKMCSPNGASSCTAIAKRGVEQMTAMGAHIRQLYSGDAATFGSATWFQPPYDVSAVSTRSIADPATVQAAAALLGGIYASESATIVPTIISTAPERDALLNVEAFPSSTITRMINAKAFNAALEAVVDEQFPDASVVEAMGAEVGLDAALCSAPATRVLCCQRLQKLAVMYAAVGATDGAPTVMANKAKLDAVAARTSTSRRATTPAYPRMWRAAALDCRLRESCFATCARRCYLRVTPTATRR
ncbi:putative membrane-bound acid phosphatase [Trypanosoma cruzi]|uniref:Putative membrane-bound acid phosphatase n=1 Tax=Trypanosoma cruzi TaxID=5693 RepID=A0A2V2V5V0_TRYCR|nr:putative membrane-bound acid phosphatase [Trypanosoma cruzi]